MSDFAGIVFVGDLYIPKSIWLTIYQLVIC